MNFTDVFSDHLGHGHIVYEKNIFFKITALNDRLTERTNLVLLMEETRGIGVVRDVAQGAAGVLFIGQVLPHLHLETEAAQGLYIALECG